MNTTQLVLSLVLALMVFSVSLELRLDDFKRVVQTPKSVICGLIPQFVLLPVGTWLATLWLDLPPNIEAAMILVAACPGGSLSNFVTHFGRGNTALSVSISAVASILALFLTPFNFAWMMAANPETAGWLQSLSIDASNIWISLLFLLAVPLMTLTMMVVGGMVGAGVFSLDARGLKLAGNIVRGRAEPIRAVVWFSDLRGFTRITDTAPEQVIPRPSPESSPQGGASQPEPRQGRGQEKEHERGGEGRGPEHNRQAP